MRARGSSAALALLAICLAASLAAAGQTFLTEHTWRLGRDTYRLAGEDRRGPYRLPHPSVIHGSERLDLHGLTLAANEDYTIRYDRGEISFPEPLAAGDTVTVRYRYFPLPLPVETYLNRLRFAEEGVSLVSREEEVASTLAGPLDRGAVRVGGSKSFAILIGSGRELKLEQALRVSVDGMLAPGVRVTARLTDENLPFQPEGSSERLEELDEVLVKIESDRAEATLGDYDVDFEGTEFARYSRVLKGALGRYKGGSYDVEASGGIARGEFLSVEIRGAEGKQGPYALLGEESRKLVVAGSEKVYLDGERLKRGEENDYVIDYNFGTLLFNPNRPIHSESRITADFQATGDEYKRSFFTNRFHLKGGDGRFRLGGTFLSERDDDDSPEALLFNEEDLDSLTASGDRQALVPSARVAENGGDYDTLGGVFVYAGPARGEFDVSFIDVGTGNGSYTREISAEWGREVFAFAGEGAGRYEPAVLLPLPSSHHLFDLRGGAALREGIDLDAEVAWSELDRNTLSPLDDDDNGGVGTSISLGVDPQSLSLMGVSLGRWSADGSWRKVDDHFEPLDRYRETERDERWMTAELRSYLTTERAADDRVGAGEASESRGGETVWNGAGRWTGTRRGGTLALSGGAGRLEMNRFESNRRGGNALLSNDRFRAGYREERVASERSDSLGRLEGDGVDRVGDGSIRIGFTRPSLALNRKRRDFARGGALVSGIRSESERYGLAVDRGRLQAEGAVTFEERDAVDSVAAAYEPWYESRTDEIDARWQGAASVRALYRRRAVDYAPGRARGNESNDLSRIEVRHGGFGGLLQANWNYQVSSEESRPREVRLVPAPADTSADYDSLGNYFPGAGGYNQVVVEGEAVPLIDLEASARFRVEPRRRRESEPNRFWAGFRSDTFLRVRERSTERDRRDLILLRPAAFQRNATTIRGTIVLRQEVRWDDRRSDGSIQLRYQREDREVNEFAGLYRDDLVHTVLVRARIPLGRRFVGETEWNRRLEREWASDDPVVDLVADDLEGRLVYQPDPSWRVRLPAAYSRETEAVLEERVTSVRIDPDLSVNISTRGRLDGSFTWTKFLDANIDRSRSFLRSRREGLRWNGSFAYELTSLLRSSLSYTGESLKGEKAQHRFRAEMRAFF